MTRICRSKLVAMTLCLTLLSGCLGSFRLTDKVLTWNRGVDSDKWIQEVIFLGLNIVPIYSIVIVGDALIFNSIEFWTGKNPIAYKEAPNGNDVIVFEKKSEKEYVVSSQSLGENYRLTVRRQSPKKLLITSEDGHTAMLVAEGEQLTWSSEGEKIVL